MKKVPDPVTAPLPVPEPADIDKAGAVLFDDLTTDLKKLEKQLQGIFEILRNFSGGVGKTSLI